MHGLSQVETHPDRIVIRTPSEPSFWYGNRVVFRDPPTDAAALLDRFHADLPGADHVTLGWDLPDMAPTLVEAVLDGLGFEIETADVVALRRAHRRKSPPTDITLRPIATDSDWSAVTDLQVETGIEDGYDAAIYRPFTEGRTDNRRRQCEAGRMCWFGAFDGDVLAGDLGLVTDGTIARFQSVETRERYRGRGICSALLTMALDWAARHAPDALPVIIADRDSAAGRLYRHRGFDPVEVMVSAIRRPPQTA